MFTEIEIKEIETIKNKDINDLKILLANKTTEMLHGKEAAKNSEQAAKEAFSGNTLGSNLPKVNIQSNKIEEKEAPGLPFFPGPPEAKVSEVKPVLTV